MGHPLQQAWLSIEAEHDYVRAIEALVHDGQVDAAATRLLDDLATIDAPTANLCRELASGSVMIEGWEDINTAIAHYEGDPITAVHVMIANATDLVFEAKSEMYEPIIEFAYYSDAHLAFSTLSREAILAESLAHAPAWHGQSEDIEAYLEIAGLGQLNTALLRHSNQYFLRPQDDEATITEAPIGYVEYTLGSLFRAVRLHQAVKAELDRNGVTGNVPVIVGMDNMRHVIGSVYQSQIIQEVTAAEVAPLAIKVKPREYDMPSEISGTSIRRRLAAQAANDVVDEPDEAPVGLLKRLFGRR